MFIIKLFFFKQKTAYEMAISDWSSDVCSSDLDRSQADDFVQDCLERAWSRIHLWTVGTNIRAWLFTILQNMHLNAARKRRNTPGLVSLAIGRATCRERVCTSGYITVVACTYKTININHTTTHTNR